MTYHILAPKVGQSLFYFMEIMIVPYVPSLNYVPLPLWHQKGLQMFQEDGRKGL